MVLCGDLRDDDDVGLIAERIVIGVHAPFVDSGRDLSVTCSVGIVITTRCPDRPQTPLIRDADAMMYEAKETGRDQYRVFDASERIGTLASRLQAELSRAIDQSELFLLYQPLFALDDQSLLGVEALVRWQLSRPPAFVHARPASSPSPSSTGSSPGSTRSSWTKPAASSPNGRHATSGPAISRWP